MTAPVPSTASVQLQTLSGDIIEARPVHVTRVPGGLVEARIMVSWQTWQRARSAGAFHLDGIDEPPGFTADKDVALILRLRDTALDMRLADAALDEAPRHDLAAELTNPESPLSHTEAWLCTEVMQSVDAPVGYAELGLRTSHARPLVPPEPGDLATLMTDCLSRLGLEHEVLDGNLVRFHAHAGAHRAWTVLIHINAEAPSAVIYSVHPRPVPHQARPGIALFLVEANHTLGRGAFEMDPEDGEVRYRSELYSPTMARLENILDENLAIMSTYFDAIASASPRP